MEESSFFQYMVAWTKVSWNSLYAVILFVYREGATYANNTAEEVTVVCNNLHSIDVLLNAVNRELSEW